MVRPAWQHAERDRNERAPTRQVGSNSVNGPKVSPLAPIARKGGVRIRLYAGNPGESGGTRMTSDNPTGADNQQESLSPMNRGAQNPQRPYAGSPARAGE